MINKLRKIKELRNKRKLVAEEELKILEKNYQFENRDQKIKDTKSKINQLKKDLEKLKDLENKFK